MTGPNDTGEMVLMGLDTSVVAPALLLLTRSWRGWQVLTLPAPVALPVFLVVHAALTIWMTLAMPARAADAGFQIGLILASVVFWLPVLCRGRCLDAGGRMVYLFLAMPTMDLAGVCVVLHGDAAGGLAMIVAMLPVGLAAVLSTWHWIATEAEPAGPFGPDPAGYPPTGEKELTRW